jgi:glycosyltransferase involved in cell wall biosynthesis
MSAASLSVCITTHQMGHVLPFVLASIGPAASEIVLLDNDSTDDTAAVAAEFPRVRLVRREFPGDYGLNKNAALDAARGDWILLLDSDELVGDRLRTALPALVATRWYDCYKLPRHWVVPGDAWRHVKTEWHHPDWQLRLFRNRPFFRYPAGETVHHHFPRRGRGRMRRLRSHPLFHLDFLLNDRAAREAKVRSRSALNRGAIATHETFYLYEDREHTLAPCKDRVSLVTPAAISRLAAHRASGGLGDRSAARARPAASAPGTARPSDARTSGGLAGTATGRFAP